MNHKLLASFLSLATVGLLGFPCTLNAAEAGGMQVEVQKSALSTKYGDGSGGMRTVNRTMTLKISVKNNTMKPMEAAKLHYTLIVQRWGLETGYYQRQEGDLDVEPLAPWRNVLLQGGEIHLGGHLHGTSERHLDHLVAWKVTITRGAESWDFVSSASFDATNAKVRGSVPNR